jgi:murein DD-endopeptidase MepM/ murein hydrolase activator NlpD
MKCSEIASAANCAASRLLLSATLVAVFHPASAQTTTPVRRNPATHAWSVRWQPAQLVNGSPIVFQITPPSRLTALTGKWLTHDVSFSYDPAGRTWYGIAGTSLETRSGAYTLELRGTTARNEVLFSRKMIVRKAKYPTIAVTVAKKYTEPSPEQMERINQDKTVKKDVFSHTDPEREWSGKFRPPVEAKISDVFGTQRVFNGKVQSMHQGLDYAVPGGTPVSAVNAGTVLLAGPLYFEGNCVVLDHGQGLMTLYLHLSEIKVKQGEKIEGGQQIGLSGGTGRASGPHLHLAVRWQGVYLNPAILLSLRLP